MNWLTEKWGERWNGEAALSVTSNAACFLWRVCFCSAQKESFCSNCFSLTGRARWVTPIGRWSKPLCIGLLWNEIITFWGVWISCGPASLWIHDSQEPKKDRERKSKGKKWEENLAHFIWVSNKLKAQWIEILGEWEQDRIYPFVILTYQLSREVSRLRAKSVPALQRQQLGSHHPLYNFLFNLGAFD